MYLEKNKLLVDAMALEGCASYRLLIVKRLIQQSFLNLCQGEFQRKTNEKARRYWMWGCGALLGVLCVSILGIKLLLLQQLHQKERVVSQQIQMLYRVFFPEATQVVSPQFRIMQLLKNHGAETQSTFWYLLNRFSGVYQKAGQGITLTMLQYQDKKLRVSLQAKDFSVLERLQQDLKQQRLIVHQIEAAMRDEQVIAVLEMMPS